MTIPHVELQRHLGPGIELGQQAQREADADPGKAAMLCCLADIYGLNSGRTPGMGFFGMGAGFFNAAWGGATTDAQGHPTGPNPLDGFGSMIRGVVATAIEFNNPFPEVQQPHRRP